MQRLKRPVVRCDDHGIMKTVSLEECGPWQTTCYSMEFDFWQNTIMLNVKIPLFLVFCCKWILAL